MARIRYIKHGFFTNEQLADCSPQARLLFAGLWVVADSMGRLEDRPRKLKAELFPFDDWDVNTLLDELTSAKLILRYESAGQQLIQVINFLKHQRPHPNEPKSLIPSPFPDEATSEVSENATDNEKKLSIVKKHDEKLQSTDGSVRNGNGNRNRNGDGKGTGVGPSSRSLREPRRPTTARLCDSDYLAQVKQNPAYSGIDVDRLFNKMVEWCKLKGKQPTRSRFLGWLNREDVPMKPEKASDRPFVSVG